MIRESTGAEPTLQRRFTECLWGQTARDRRNNKRFVALCLVWAVCFTGVDLIQEKTAVSDSVAWALAFVPALPAIATVAAYLKFLHEADEMIRRVHLTGLAVGFGAGAFVVMGIQAPGLAGDRIFDKELVFAALVFGWVFGQLWATWRYK